MPTIKARELLTLKDKSIGLLGKKEYKTVYFKTRFGIHTFFMKFPIDVVLLDNESRVVKIKKMKQNRIFFWNPMFKKVLELPEGSIKKLRIKIGSKIYIHNP
jgi:uncharacterized membrane protein (UPF0127 family)